MKKIMVSARDCTKQFGSTLAVDHLSFEVQPAEVFALVGPDGAGKSTLLRMLAGLVEPDAGDLVVAGHDVRLERTALCESVGYMAQRFGLYTDLTVEENMRFYADLYGIRDTERESMGRELLEMTRLEPFRQRRAGHLSGGMQQKLALVCTLLHRPEILLLDQPTSGVDPLSRGEFWTILYRLVREGLTIVLTTAYLDEAERANRVGFLFRGRLIRCDAPEELKRSMPESGFQVDGPSLAEIRKRLARAEGVISVTPSGSGLHLFFAPEETSIDRLVREAGYGPSTAVRFSPIAPSLEDVFITEVVKAGRSEARR